MKRLYLMYTPNNNLKIKFMWGNIRDSLLKSLGIIRWESSDINIINNYILCSHVCMEEGEIEFTKYLVHLAIHYSTRNFPFC